MGGGVEEVGNEHTLKAAVARAAAWSFSQGSPLKTPASLLWAGGPSQSPCVSEFDKAVLCKRKA